MEKSSKIILTKEEMTLFRQGILPEIVAQRYGFTSITDLKLAIDAGEYEIESTPLQTELDLC